MDQIKQLTDIIQNSSNIVAFTGAGVSTESNIPDFRSSGGLFETLLKKYNQPAEVILSHGFFMEHPDWFYDFYRNGMIYRDATPNDCHKVLATLEQRGRLKAVITQNIDGLHTTAGNKNVIEIHGTIHRNYCNKCGKGFSLEYVMDMTKPVPLCDKCGEIVRPDVVLYEENLDEELIEKAVNHIMSADVMLVMGTSLVVYPAAGFINYYKGNKLVLINKSPTPFDGKAQLVINQSAGASLRRVMENMG
ncbi:MAG: NAD-dependent protein deacylase [Bacillota bacterium]|nr:NAD-dependent protein deacylase [Bacillota bacterium]